MSSRTPLSWKKKLAFSLAIVIPGLLMLEGICSLIWVRSDYRTFRESLPIAIQSPEAFHARHDPEIGWEHIPGAHFKDFYGPGRNITINDDGFRGDEEYLGKKSADRFRLVLLGDSFTLGYGVDDAETYAAHLAKLNPTVQAVNMGQGGYSIGQCYLWHKRVGKQLEPDCVVFAFILDDIWRMVSGRLANGYAMPGFEVNDGGIHVTDQPVPDKITTGSIILEDGQTRDFFLERILVLRTVDALIGDRGNGRDLGLRTEQLRVAQAMFDEIHRELTARNVRFVMMLMPEQRELADQSLATDYRAVSSIFRNFAAARLIPLLDVHDVFSQTDPASVQTYYLPEQWHHFSETGNHIVARELNKFLTQTVEAYPDKREHPAPRNEPGH